MPTQNAQMLSDAIGAIFEEQAGASSVDKALRAVRRHLSMDIAFVSQFGGTERVMRHVDADNDKVLQQGMSIPLDAGYCRHVVEGRLPGVIPDTADVALARQIPETAAIPIGAHLSVPIWLSDGSLYGTFCCFSHQPDETLGQRDLQFMNVFAELLADRLEEDMLAARLKEEKRNRIERVFSHDELSVVYQPIYRLDDGTVSGMECLARFRGAFHATPDKWFADAAEVGMGIQLESHAIRQALSKMDSLPRDVYLAVNGSPELFMSDELARAVEGVDPSRVVLEVTEHASVSDYRQLWNSLAAWRNRGMRIAIDDAGAGYSSMRHILDLQPEYIKLDISLVRNIDADARRRALAAALIAFAREIGAAVTAEGVETEAELQTLRHLGVDKVQGFHMSRPVSAQRAAELATQSRQRAALAAAEVGGRA
ncbi:EAL domain-containing protein [Xylophilus sp. GOD-11R]|uniref:sensor domain-containing phosphodiesterase n=1 Tax=Xylophilus sp. GOD-11R TaxID=3089814 RepID=UPI00298CEAC8|nr:EAL domain-containing protein [Xylophilus sp. GOD-11R]WPB58808.1 EAL domain-containing protein [Xylophilus sp. GOD-11R]